MNKRRILKTLSKIGVDTRYISIYEDVIYINNLRLSKFSRQKEVKFNEIYPDIPVIRSTLLQKICIKASRELKNQIKPRETIYIKKTENPEDILLEIILEPYTRKYGITITYKITDDIIYASNKYLDKHVDEYFKQMINAQKITNQKSENTIYPLNHIYYEWIEDFIKSTNIKYNKTPTISEDENIRKLNNFIKKHIPQYKESIKQSVGYLDNGE